MSYWICSRPVVFHGFVMRPGFIYGRDSMGEFACSGRRRRNAVFVYRRLPCGQWIGQWETFAYAESIPGVRVVCDLCGWTEAAQIVSVVNGYGYWNE